MAIENQISNLTDALDRNTAATVLLRELLLAKPVEGAPTPAPTKTAETVKPAKATKAAKAETKVETKAPDVEEDDFDTPTAETKALVVDDLRKALVALQRAKGSAEASRGVLKANGVTSLSAIKDEQQDLIAKCIAECEKQMPKAA